MKQTLTIVILVLLQLIAQAQLESNWWYFGQAAGMHFSSGYPVADTSSQALSGAGAATMSDSLGKLLFYKGGDDTLWNTLHQPMLNSTGLINDGPSEQSAVAIPRPNIQDQYYLFISDYASFISNSSISDSGLFYHLIDMSLDGGLGGVVPGQKNVILMDSTAEKIAATPHANGTDYWVMVQQ